MQEAERVPESQEAPAAVLDVKGLSCPMPVVRTRKAIDGIAVGQVLEVVATDPGSMADFRAWAKHTGHELLLAEQRGDVYVYRIRRAK
jgi:tRNA 2-thiouridine synthesizing protein A